MPIEDMGMNEEIVSFETAKLLKEKGFPQRYDIYHGCVYNEEEYETSEETYFDIIKKKVDVGELSCYPAGVPDPKCYAPTLSLVQKWLREEKNIYIDIQLYNPCFPFEYETVIYKVKEDGFHLGKYFGGVFKTYDDALETGIKHALETYL